MAKKQAKLPRKTKMIEAKKTDYSVEILGTVINGTQRERVLRILAYQRKNLLHLMTVNPEFVMEARVNPQFEDTMKRAELKVADGWGLVWATRILEGRWIERITGGMITKWILQQANTRGEKVFLLGGQVGVAEKAAQAMKKRYPNAKIAWFEGARTVKVERRDEASMTIAKINGFEPDYLLVAYGSPWQDMWIEENRQYLRARVALGVGGVLDEWAGVVTPCPEWLERIGGKWLFRLFSEPWRLPRIIKVLKFGVLVLWMRLKRLI